MAPNMSLTPKKWYVVKLANEAMQPLRVKLRCSAIDAENEAIKEAKKKGKIRV